MKVLSRKAAISMEFSFSSSVRFNGVDSADDFEMRNSGSESQLSKLAERMLVAALDHANMVPSAPMCLFPNVVVDNKAALWIIT